MPVLLEHDLAATEFMRFNVGTSRDVIRIQTADFIRLVTPRVASFATKRPVVKAYSPLPERHFITEQAIRC